MRETSETARKLDMTQLSQEKDKWCVTFALLPPTRAPRRRLYEVIATGSKPNNSYSEYTYNK